MFRRKVYERIMEWKAGKGSTGLLIEGPLRVGKTTVVEEFARNEFDSYLLIDFSIASKDVTGLFHRYSNDLDSLFLYLQLEFGVELFEQRSVIVFDEIQFFPFARQMIKHLVKDGRYYYIETGSLVSIRGTSREILIPSEEDRIQMNPMDFEEFLWATGDTVTSKLLRRSFDDRTPLNEVHDTVMRKFTEYMLVGGMPQAVSEFIETNNFDRVEESKTRILNLYLDDTEKSGASLGPKTRQILTRLPAMLSRHEKRFTPSAIRKDSRTREYIKAVNWLMDSKMVNGCFRISDPSPTMALSVDESMFKLYMADTGLLITSTFMSNSGDRSDIYKALVSGRLGINKGMFLENAVAQALVASGHHLWFGRFVDQTDRRSYEVDFLIADSKRVMPIEVKSGQSMKHASLDRYADKYDEWIDQMYVVHTKDLRVDGDLVYIPVYMAMFL